MDPWANMAGRRNKNTFTFVLFKVIDANSGCLECGFGRFRCGLVWFGVGLGWFWANMAGRHNKNAFKFVLQLLILTQKQILGVANVVWGGLEVVWSGLGCFHGPVKGLKDICYVLNTSHIEMFLYFCKQFVSCMDCQFMK